MVGVGSGAPPGGSSGTRVHPSGPGVRGRPIGPSDPGPALDLRARSANSPGVILPPLSLADRARAAAVRIRPFVARTPLVRDAELSARLGRDVLLKLESCQVTGSFKVRGAAAALTALPSDRVAAGVVTCSSGNHGRAVAWVAARLGIPATIFLPSWTDPVKIRAIAAEGARIEGRAASYDAAEARALAFSTATGAEFIPPFDDPEVIAGQGTLALEILEEIETPSAVVAPLSGGGLVGGICAVLEAASPRTLRVAASAERARTMLESIRAGHPIELPEEPTLASALSGGIGAPNRWTFSLVRDLVHAHQVVPETAIPAAIRHLHRASGTIAEGGGAVPVATLLGKRPEWLSEDPGPIVVIVSGGNLSAELIARILD